jgi:hypothetical protein
LNTATSRSFPFEYRAKTVFDKVSESHSNWDDFWVIQAGKEINTLSKSLARWTCGPSTTPSGDFCGGCSIHGNRCGVHNFPSLRSILTTKVSFHQLEDKIEVLDAGCEPGSLLIPDSARA